MFTLTDFLPRDAMHSADCAVARCLSVIRRYSDETAQHIIQLFLQHITLITVPNVMAIFRRGPPNGDGNPQQRSRKKKYLLTGGGRIQRGMKKSRFSTSISLYLKNDTRSGHSYYGM